VRISKLFGHTLRNAPADVERVSERLLLRAGMIRPAGDRGLVYLPLGWQVMRKLESLLRREMDALGGQELCLPAVQCVKGRTRKAIVAALVQREIDSYRQLPSLLYQTQFCPTDGRLFCTADVGEEAHLVHEVCGLYGDRAELDAHRDKMLNMYRDLLARLGIDVVLAETRGPGGRASRAWTFLGDGGRETYMVCDTCGYAASLEWATFLKPTLAQADGIDMAPLAQVATPGCKTIADVARFVGVPTEQTLKAVFWATCEPKPQLVLAVIRGDLDVNEVKLRDAVGCDLHKAEENEIRAVGAVPGYASPVGIRGARVIADDSACLGRNLVAGANREGFHLTGVNYGRDYTAEQVVNIALARPGDRCSRCAPHSGGTLIAKNGTELARCTSIGALSAATYSDPAGLEQPVWMAYDTVHLERLMFAVVETCHDEYGICWPGSAAPYRVHIVSLVQEDELVARVEAVYNQLIAAGIDVLYDDRVGLSAGVKFNDADLIGCPLRLTFGRRNLAQGCMEAKLRTASERRLISLDAFEELEELLA
jgi:prolyl-tRNA synthetase